MDFVATVQASGETPSLVLPLLGCLLIWHESGISLCSTAEGDCTYFGGSYVL